MRHVFNAYLQMDFAFMLSVTQDLYKFNHFLSACSLRNKHCIVVCCLCLRKRGTKKNPQRKCKQILGFSLVILIMIMTLSSSGGTAHSVFISRSNAFASRGLHSCFSRFLLCLITEQIYGVVTSHLDQIFSTNNIYVEHHVFDCS